MRRWEKGILDEDSAREYFCDMGCSHFFMSREHSNRYDEYCALQISRETEAVWRLEDFEARLRKLLHDQNGESELWWQHSALARLAADSKSPGAIRALCDATPIVARLVTGSTRILVAETLVGGGNSAHPIDVDGVLGLADGIGDNARAKELAELVPEFCNGSSAPSAGPPFEDRRQFVLRKLEVLKKRFDL